MKKKALIVGCGLSGLSAAKLAQKLGYEVIFYEDCIEKVPKEYHCLSKQSKIDPSALDMAIVSPGINPEHEVYSFLKKKPLTVLGEATFALQHLKQNIFAITGTNGKTTMTCFVEHLLKTLGKKAKAVGNNGFPLSEYVLKADPEETLVCELSSFQLETMKGSFFDKAVILNIGEDHLDRYIDKISYAQAKLSLFQCMKGKATVMMREEDVKTFYQYIPSQSLDLLTAQEIKESLSLKKMLSLKNIYLDSLSLAWMKKIATYFKASLDQLVEALSTFQKPFHRIEFVDTVNEIHFVNDSKATNLEAVAFALQSFSCPIHLILGGKDKGFDFFQLKDIVVSKVKTILAIGEMQEKIDISLNKHVKVLKVESLDRAVKEGFKRALPQETVLLSPGCSSYDQFLNFEQRGEVFKKYVLELKQRNAL